MVEERKMAKILYARKYKMCDEQLERRLRRKGFEGIRALDGEEAIKLAHDEQPDLILISTDLPAKDAWTVIKKMKTAENTQNIPLIALLDHKMSTEDIEQALAAGCDDYDRIPIELPRLLEKINRLLSC